ncbi:Transcription factor UPBEAT1 [Glycine max]|nr:Transcription factor UPBEAT1 [Glycine max]
MEFRVESSNLNRPFARSRSILLLGIPISFGIRWMQGILVNQCLKCLERASFIMGISSQPSLVSFSLKDLIQGTEENKTSSSYGCLWSKVLTAQAKKVKGTKRSVRRPRRILMMNRRSGSRRGSYNGIRRRVRTLKSLVPNSDSLGLDGLFRQTADYILSLQTRVRVMQVMVKVLTGSDE